MLRYLLSCDRCGAEIVTHPYSAGSMGKPDLQEYEIYTDRGRSVVCRSCGAIFAKDQKRIQDYIVKVEAEFWDGKGVEGV